MTEITIEKCLFPMSAMYLCEPKTTSEQDAIKGKWVRVNRDLNLESGLWSLYVYYRRSRRLDVDLIRDIVLLPSGEEPTTPGNWHKVSTSLRDGVPRVSSLFLWYNLGTTLSNLTSEEKSNLITELDVLFGSDRPWYGFEKLEPATTTEQKGRLESAWLTYRRGVKRNLTLNLITCSNHLLSSCTSSSATAFFSKRHLQGHANCRSSFFRLSRRMSRRTLFSL